MRAILSLLIVALLVPFTGCTHAKLRRNMVNQAKTLSEIYQQQVLDNLAMFVVNPHALPFFAFPKDGTSSVTDRGDLSAQPFNAFRITAGGSFSRQDLEQWGLTPVVEPDKLARMRCAYQRAVGYHEEFCIQCCELEKQWRGLRDLKVKVWDPIKQCPMLNPDTGLPYDFSCPDGSPMFVQGIPTQIALETCIDPEGYTIIHRYDCDEACAVHCGWLEVGSLKDLPANCSEMIGRYGDTCVWVRPGCEDQLTRLTLMILDYAINDPPAVLLRQKTVMFYIDQYGNVVHKSDARGEVQAVIGLDDHVTSIITVDRAAIAEARARVVRLLSRFNKLQNMYGQETENRKTGIVVELNQTANALNAAIQEVERLESIPVRPATPPASPIVIPKQRTLRPSEFGFGRLDIQRDLRSISPSLQLNIDE